MTVQGCKEFAPLQTLPLQGSIRLTNVENEGDIWIYYRKLIRRIWAVFYYGSYTAKLTSLYRRSQEMTLYERELRMAGVIFSEI